MIRSIPLAGLADENLTQLMLIFAQQTEALPVLSAAICSACKTEIERRQAGADSEPGYFHGPVLQDDERTLALYQVSFTTFNAAHFGDAEIVDFLKAVLAPLCCDATGQNPLASQNEKREN